MLSIEEYIARRKKEDGLSEFNITARIENMKTVIDYVFEYFNNYLNINELDERTVFENEKIKRFYGWVKDYDSNVKDWLLDIFKDHGKNIIVSVSSIIKKDVYFLLYNKDSEFRSLSYDCYAKLIKKHDYLRNQTEMLYLFIKEYHRVQSQRMIEINSMPDISDDITDWIETTWARYQVSIIAFVENWLRYFSNNENLWPKTHRIKSPDFDDAYDYNYKQKTNLFNLDSLYSKMPKKPYTKGRKQDFEILMMYYWTNDNEGDKDYWEEYLNQVLPSIDKNM